MDWKDTVPDDTKYSYYEKYREGQGFSSNSNTGDFSAKLYIP